MSHRHIFRFKEFSIKQQLSAMKVGIDGVLLGAWTKASGCKSVLDIGSGTGLLALMMAQKSIAEIDAIEINEHAYKEALYNVEKSPWEKRIHVQHSSFNEFAINSKQKYDLIISNPPFFKEDIKSESDERKQARSSDSLQLSELLSISKKMMHINSRLSFIYPYSRFDEIINICSEQELYFSRICFVKPNPIKEYHRILIELSLQESNTSESQIMIENKDHLYFTKEFMDLTKDYYLTFKNQK